MFNVKTVVMVEKWKGHMLSASGGRFDERPDKRQYSSKICIFHSFFNVIMLNRTCIHLDIFANPWWAN